MMNTLVNMSLAGSAVFLLWLAVSRVLKNRLPARWHYRILKASLFFFLVPVGRLIPLAARALAALAPAPAAPVSIPVQTLPRVSAAAIPRVPAPVLTPVPLPEPEAPSFALTAGGLRALAAVWALGTAAVLAYKLWVYLRLRRRLFRCNRPASHPEAQTVFWTCKRELGIRGPVTLRENPLVRSPLAAGLSWPTVVIPAAPLEAEELRYMFLHELTHIKHGDLWMRFAAMLAQAVHWFNPLAYLLCRSIRTVSEQSCDERVVCPMSRAERYAYGSVIVKLAANVTAGSGDWAASLSTRESIERRLTRVLRTENLKGGKRLLALLLAASMLACGTAAALAAKPPLPVVEKIAAAPQLAAPQPAGTTAAGVKSTPRTGTPAAGVKSAPHTGTPAAGAPAVTVPGAEDGAAEPKETGRPVTTNGTPGEAFLKELREYFADCGATEDTPVLFGDHELIVSRGGTLLPDEELSSYTCVFGGSENKSPVIYKEFYTKNSGFDPRVNAYVNVCMSEYDVGKPEALEACSKFISPALYNLVNGEYPKNSKGESYGHDAFSDYVGYHPDLHAAQGTKGELGYIYDPDEAALPHNLPKDECPHSFLVPLYDKEHNEIGKFEMSCGGHIMEDVIAKGLTVEETKAALAAGESSAAPTYDSPSEETLAQIREKWGAAADTPVIFGDKERILSRGGTLLPDNDPSSYAGAGNVLYKCFLGKDGVTYQEYKVGNTDLLDAYRKKALDQLVNGDYPRNNVGETYGSTAFSSFVGYSPDLIAAVGVDNVEGYIRERDTLGYALLQAHDVEGYMALIKANPGPRPIPLYDSEGKVIGTFMHGGGHSSEDLGTAGMSIEEAKAAMAALFGTDNAQ